MRRKQKPTCFIIAGPNGAGKTTFALRYLPQIAGCRNFVNADLIAYGLSPFDSVSAQYEAGRLFLREIFANIDRRVDFAFETTLAGRSHISLLKKLRKDGWQVVLFFLWIPDAAFSKRRVRERVEQGGHDIPDDTIYRRYPRIMNNLVKIYIPLCDKVVCYDNSGAKPIPVFEQVGKDRRIFNQELYERVLRQSGEREKNE
ncbi:MAG: zeta toxin family protein [Sedimentisphaerales bacterium]|nr:zeta toxin family protein [Sedimentisphaerales bacterium]